MFHTPLVYVLVFFLTGEIKYKHFGRMEDDSEKKFPAESGMQTNSQAATLPVAHGRHHVQHQRLQMKYLCVRELGEAAGSNLTCKAKGLAFGPSA